MVRVGCVVGTVQDRDGPVKVDGVPKNDGRGEEIQPAGPIALLLEGPVPDLSKPVEEIGPGQRVSALALVQAGRGRAAQVRVLIVLARWGACLIW